ncbi:MOSC domain-containing protein [Anaerosinus massiliensis]|uniref:MOSC domain-containing protein n=1 Tax=Massilibacillus massiliensis TaxID=1806837 RepID=UPI000B1F2F60|nr:MOSC domain-containing protein [Massilibacillus massiliensis]
MGRVMAVCMSEKKGTKKRNVFQGEFQVNHGLVGDAHAGNWHRQVSLLSFDKVEAFRAKGAEVIHGDFGENLVVAGIDFKTLPVGTRLKCNDVEMEVTQIGKECHAHCEIYKTMGDCIMPREGVFVKILHEGTIAVDDAMEIVE